MEYLKFGETEIVIKKGKIVSDKVNLHSKVISALESYSTVYYDCVEDYKDFHDVDWSGDDEADAVWIMSIVYSYVCHILGCKTYSLDGNISEIDITQHQIEVIEKNMLESEIKVKTEKLEEINNLLKNI